MIMELSRICLSRCDEAQSPLSDLHATRREAESDLSRLLAGTALPATEHAHQAQAHRYLASPCDRRTFGRVPEWTPISRVPEKPGIRSAQPTRHADHSLLRTFQPFPNRETSRASELHT